MPSRREFVRVQAEVDLKYEPISVEQWPEWESGSRLVSRRRAAAPPVEVDYGLGRMLAEAFEPEVARFLEGLDRKVTALLNLASVDRGGEDGMVRLSAELSACGIAFPCEELAAGERVLLTLRLPGPEPRQVEVVARVVRISQVGGARWVALAFDQITAADRETLVRFTLGIQRDLARLHAECGAGK
ncbi:MAG: PilZ domain-containing protein [Nitrospirae bacterium]|nr:MAG: PilZ domain-containing protein [Nitrospirota bacterium]